MIKRTLLILAATGLVYHVASPYMALATLSYLMLIRGYHLRRKRNLHIAYMMTGISLDILLVLMLEIERNAINTATSFTLSPLQQAHIATSSIALVLYFPTMLFGFLLLLSKGASMRLRIWHHRVAITALLFRTLGFFLMFSLLFK